MFSGPICKHLDTMTGIWLSMCVLWCINSVNELLCILNETNQKDGDEMFIG